MIKIYGQDGAELNDLTNIHTYVGAAKVCVETDDDLNELIKVASRYGYIEYNQISSNGIWNYNFADAHFEKEEGEKNGNDDSEGTV